MSTSPSVISTSPGSPYRQGSVPGYDQDGSPRPTIIPSCSAARCSRSCTGVMITGRHGREEASRKLDRYELAKAAEQRFESLSGGQQARLQILLLELSGATCCSSTSRPTISTWSLPGWNRDSIPSRER